MRSLPAPKKSRLQRLSFLIAYAAVLTVASACSQEQGSSPLADQELSENSEIYLGADQYQIQAVSLASQEGENSSQAKQAPVAPQAASATAPTGGASAPVAAAPRAKATPKPKPKPKPIDIEYILTKSKDISVGLSSGMPQARIQNDSKAFIPASITKVITTGVALKQLGPKFRYKTILSFERNDDVATNLVILADGDPTVGKYGYNAGAPDRMDDMVAALKSKGIAEVQGAITLLSVDPRLDVVHYPAGIPNIDMRECYGSLSSSFNYRNNCAGVRVNSKTGYRWEAEGIDTLMTNTLETSTADRSSLALVPTLSPTRALEGFVLRGTYSSKSPRTLNFNLPVGNGAGWYGQMFIKALQSKKMRMQDVRIKHAVSMEERNAATTNMKRWATTHIVFESAELMNIVEAVNKPSDNFLADSVFKAVGVRSSKPNVDLLDASHGKLKETVDAWLHRDGHPDWQNDLNFLDGAGLSTENRATPRAFLAVLRQLANEPTFDILRESLAVAGEDGTLHDRMGRSAANGRVHAKTGTLTGSYQLVGYVTKKSGNDVEYVPFVILTSTSAKNRDKVRKFQDALVAKMVETVNRRDVAKE